MDDADRERLERLLDAVTLAGNADEVRREIEELEHLAERARAVEDASNEAKLNKLHTILHEEGFFDNPEQRLLIFTEFRDTLNHILDRLKSLGVQHGADPWRNASGDSGPAWDQALHGAAVP